MRAEQDKETSGDHLAKMTSMSGFKFAVFSLFNSPLRRWLQLQEGPMR